MSGVQAVLVIVQLVLFGFNAALALDRASDRSQYAVWHLVLAILFAGLAFYTASAVWA